MRAATCTAMQGDPGGPPFLLRDDVLRSTLRGHESVPQFSRRPDLSLQSRLGHCEALHQAVFRFAQVAPPYLNSFRMPLAVVR